MDKKNSNNILYVCNWDKNKEKSWSGTHYHFYKALEKYSYINDINVGYYKNNFTKLLRIFDRVISYFFYEDSLFRDKYYHLLYKNLFSQSKRADVIQFDELFQFINTQIHQYIYIDASVDFICKLIKNDFKLFQISGFNFQPSEYYINRRSRQNAYFNKCNGIFCMGHWLQKEIIESGICDPNKVYWIGGGCNLPIEDIDYTLKENNKILFVGKDFDRKNGPLVVEAFKRAKIKMPQLELYIAGPSEAILNKEEQRKYTIHCLGQLNFNDLIKYFNKCDIFCMPSKFEAYGLVFTEALIFGLPCIGANRFEMPYFIEDGKTGYLLKNDDPDELAELMLKAINNKDMIKYVKSKKNEYIVMYSWDSVAKRAIDIIQSNW